MDSTTAYIILGCAVPWIVVVTWQVAKTMFRVKELETRHKQCHNDRIIFESNYHNDHEVLAKSLAVIENNVEWIRKQIENKNGTNKNGG